VTVFCPNCGKPNTDTATACVACAQVFKRRRTAGEAAAEQKPAKPDPRMLVDETEERAWVAFATAPNVKTSDVKSVAQYADALLAEFRARRPDPKKDGPYR